VPGNERAREYRRAIQVLPERTTFLPVATLPPVGRTHPLLHAHAWATIDRGAISPYLFSADRNDAMTYFRYRRRGVGPFIFWYTRGGPEPDWAAVARDYRHLVVTEPVDLARIGVAGRWRLRTPVASVLDVAGAPTASGTIEAAPTVPTGEPAAR
jgi:hypothetical protein